MEPDACAALPPVRHSERRKRRSKRPLRTAHDAHSDVCPLTRSLAVSP